MGLDINNKKTYYFVDEYGMFVTQSTKTNPFARGDSIQDTLNAYIAYDYKPFVDAVKKCFVEKKDRSGDYIEGYRHPFYFDLLTNSMSRDHIINTLVLMKLSGEDKYLKLLSKKLRWKISDKYSHTLDSWLWMKGIAGNKLFMFIYYLIDIPFLFLSVLWSKFFYLIGGFKKEMEQEEFDYKKHKIKSKWKLFCKSMLYPIYAFHIKAITMYASPNSIGKWIIEKICLFYIDKKNYLIRLLLGDKKIKEEDILSYKPMYDNRWTSYLNELNDRHLLLIKNQEHIESNVLDVDLLRKIYYSNYPR